MKAQSSGCSTHHFIGNIVFFALSGILMLFLALADVAWPRGSESVRLEIDNIDRTPRVRYEPAASAQSTVRQWGQTRAVGAIPSPGSIVGTTFADVQHWGFAANQLVQHNGWLQVLYCDMANPYPQGPIEASWNRIRVTGSSVPAPLDNGDIIRVLPLGLPQTPDGTPIYTADPSLYTSLDLLPDGRAVAFYTFLPTDSAHMDINAVGIETGLGVFSFHPIPNPVGVDTLIEPRGRATVACGDTLIHVVACRWGNGNPNEVRYWRGTLSDTVVSWSQPVLLDTAAERQPIIASHGDSVAIIYGMVFDPEVNGFNWDLVYRLSTDCGLTWSDRRSISNYEVSSDERFWGSPEALFDDDGTLHVIWATVHYDTSRHVVTLIPARLNHWSSARTSTRRITEADWSNRVAGGGCSNARYNGTGYWSHTIAEANLALKPAGAGPGAGIADELLYAVWAQAGPTTDDCAAEDSAGTPGGVVNGEIYMSVSSDGGFTWDRPQNLTGTRTPNCLPGDCHSEHWVSAAERVDSGLYLSYTDDSFGGQSPADFTDFTGFWSESPYRVMAVEAREPVPAPVIEVGPPTSFVELNVGTTGTDSVELAIQNLGNSDLDFTVVVMGDDGGASHVQVNHGASYSGTAAKGAPAEVVNVTFDGVGLTDPSEHDWRLEITSNDSLNNPSVGGDSIDVHLNVFVADTWYTCEQDTISTGTHRLAVGSCLELGDQGAGGGFYGYALTDEWLFDASPVVTYRPGAGGASFAYRDIHMSGVVDRSRDSNQAFRAQSDVTIARDTIVNVSDTSYSADVARGTASSTDSIFRVDWEVRAYREGELVDGMVAKYTLSNWNAGTGDSGTINLGVAADLDVDSMAAWNDGIGSYERQYIGAQGGYGNEDLGQGSYIPQPNFAAVFHIPLDSVCSDLGVGAQVLDNADYIYPEGGYHTDTLVSWFESMVGWIANTFQVDTITDVNVILRSAGPLTWTGTETYEWAFGLAVSSLNMTDLESKIQLLRTTLNPGCPDECAIEVPGDVNVNGNVTSSDVIVLVNYVFKGGADPAPCAANGDVNCNGSVTAADIIHEVNYVFKGGAPPCDICNEPSAMECTLNP